MNFVAFAALHGVLVKKLAPSPRVQRCGTTDKPRGTAGAFFWDGDGGWVMNWSTDQRTYRYEKPDDGKHEVPRDSVRSLAPDKIRCPSIRASAALTRAAQMLRQPTAAPHPYLVEHALSHIRGHVSLDGELLVPMCGLRDSRLRGVQIIRRAEANEGWATTTLATSSRAAILRLGPAKFEQQVLCTSYASGLSIQQALDLGGIAAATIICFEDENLRIVARLLQRSSFETLIFPVRGGQGEISAIATDLRTISSSIDGEDANGVHQRLGLSGLLELLREGLRS